jgi:hypothetical protein
MKAPSRPSPAVLALSLGAVASGLCAVALVVFYGIDAWPELAAGCCAAVANGAIHALISSKSTGTSPRAFLRWGIAMNALRIMAVLGTLAAVCFVSRLRFAPFALSFVAGTVVFLVCNVAAMANGGAAVKDR